MNLKKKKNPIKNKENMKTKRNNILNKIEKNLNIKYV